MQMTLSTSHCLLVKVSSILRAILQTPFLYRFTTGAFDTFSGKQKDPREMLPAAFSASVKKTSPVWTFHFLILDGCGVQTLKIGIHGKFYDIATGYVAQVPVRKSCESIRHLMIFRLWKLSMNNNTIVSLHESISQSFTHAAKLLKHACLYHCLCCIECHEGSDDLRTCSNAKSEILRSTDALSL